MALVFRAWFVAFLCVVAGLPLRGQVIFNELMYHPASENPRHEYIELFNTSSNDVDLTNWKLVRGVDFTIPSNTVIRAGGYFVIAADRLGFFQLYGPSITNVVGSYGHPVINAYPDRNLTNWVNLLSNTRNRLILQDAAGDEIDSIEYADEGDWAFRRRTLSLAGQRGWQWWSEHDGEGKSMELVNPNLPNQHGQNWAASIPTNGTPGRVNSVLSPNIAPLILNGRHFPAVPSSSSPVSITARIVDEQTTGLQVTLFYRDVSFSAGSFNTLPMLDDGAHGDGAPGDGLYGAVVPPFSHNTVIDFYVQASDAQANVRTWPSAALPAPDDTSGVPAQLANALYQVDDDPSNAYGGTDASQPVYKLIMSGPEATQLRNIPCSGSQESDAQMNTTFISLDGTETRVQYLCGTRNRGHGSRCANPPNYRVNFRSDDPWKGVTALNINSRMTYLQVLGSALALKSGVAGTLSRAVQIRVNNENRASGGSDMFGSYAANEAYNGDWVERMFPGNEGGNLYSVLRDINPAEFNYRGTNVNSYRNTYFKDTNASEDDYRDIMGMLAVMGTNGPVPFDGDSVPRVIDPAQWLRHIGYMSLVGNTESGINMGHNDDYYMYRGVNDPRFVLAFHDLDQLFGMGGQQVGTGDTIFGATTFPPRGTGDDDGIGRAMNRFMHSQNPPYETQYYTILQQLLDTTFSQAEFEALVDQVLGSWVGPGTTSQIKGWMSQRRASVQQQIDGLVPPPPAPGPRATLAGDPRSPYPFRNITLTVGGEGITHYRFRRNVGAYSPVTPISTPITITNMPQGSTNVVVVLGRLANGTEQSSVNPTISRTWIVDTNWSTIRLNEVLARNNAAYNHEGTFPDLIELYNEGTNPVDLAGMRLTDDPSNPDKFAFPSTIVPPGGYIVVFANNPDGTSGLHAGFNLNQSGDGVYLYASPGSGGALLDSVEFGLQAPNLSIGRIGTTGGLWVLTQPTVGSANVAAAASAGTNVVINELLIAGTTPIADDFIELYNPNSLPVALGGLYLTDNAIGAPNLSRIRDLSFMGPGQFVSFVADGTTNEADHAGFQLASEQGEVALVGANNAVIDCVSYGPQRLNVPIGRCPDGLGSLTPREQATPGFPNWCPGGTSQPPATVTFVPINASWKYNTAGVDLGSAWRSRTYDDGTWPSGAALLYGGPRPGNLPQFPSTLLPTPGNRWTYYFRTTFTVPQASSISVLQLNHVIDDGAVFYLNSNEVARFNMPNGAVSYSTPANQSVFNAGFEGPINIAVSNLLAGENVLAVEVHQTSLNNADVCMGALLEGLIVTNPPTSQSITISEVLADNAATLRVTNITATGTNVASPDLVELYNPSDSSIDLADASFTDAINNPRRWVFPPGSVVVSRGYLTVRFDSDAPPTTNTSAILNTGFGLSANGESLYLISSIASGSTILDTVTFGPQVPDLSISRLPNSSTNWTLTIPTIGETNRLPAALASANNLKVNEWMASPASGEDWFEIYNPSAQPVALAGLHLSDRLDQLKYTIPPLSFIGFGTNAWLRFNADGGVGANHAEFRLAAGGEAVGIFTSNGDLIDGVRYELQEFNVSEGRLPDGAPGTNYVRFPGTASPGDPNFAPLTNIIVNEVLAHSEPPLQDAIELRNLTAGPVNLGGWWLSDAKLTPRKYQIPAGTTIPGNGFVVLYESQFNNGDVAAVPFSLSSVNGDEVYLSAATNNGVALTGFRSVADFGPSENSVSMGPWRTSHGVEEFVALSALTLSNANAYPKVGPIVISEVMYHPPDDLTNDNVIEEFIELRNTAATDVGLFHPAHPENRWRLRDAVDFTFPTNTSIPAGGYLVVVSFDPITNPGALAAFQAKYGSNATLVGPYIGKLDNSTDSVELTKPEAPNLVLGDDFGKVPYVLVDKVEYADLEPWPMNADGLGQSIHRVHMAGYGNDPTNWVGAAPSPGPSGSGGGDTDNDGMPDLWEDAYNLDRNNPNDAGQDADNDGLTNLQEFRAGTDPRDDDSYLKITSVAPAPANVAITFNAVADKTYTIQYRDTVSGGSWTWLLNVPAQPSSGPVTVYDIDPDTNPQRYYRLVTPQTP